MPERFPLPHWRLVEDVCHPPHEVVIKGHLTHFHSHLLALTNHISGRSFYLLVPPVVKARDWKNGERLPFRVVWVFRFDLRNALPKRKDVWIDSRAFLQSSNHGGRVIYIFVPLVLKPYDCQWPVGDGEALSADFYTLNLSRLSFDQSFLIENL